MKKKKDKKKNSIKKSNIFLVLVTSLIFFGGFAKTVIAPEPINYYENRTAYQYQKPSIKQILNKEYQDGIEGTLGDQLPGAITMKKGYNTINVMANYSIMKVITKDYCKDNYVSMLPGLLSFGCDDVLVYKPTYIEDRKETFDLRIGDINNALKATKADVYVYYIERDTDVDFSTGKETKVSDYVVEHLNTEQVHVYEINSFDEFKNNFYTTDHHWNHDGSYRGYVELAEFLGVKKTLEQGEERCVEKTFAGSKAAASGSSMTFKEDFCAYDYELPEHTITINGKESEYYSLFTLQGFENPVYGSYYGWDYAEIIFDYNQKKKDNILLIGDSYDNAILELIASHYNKTYSIDVRHYEREFGQKFDYTKYIKDNDIDKVIFIGGIDYYSLDEFRLEVE